MALNFVPTYQDYLASYGRDGDGALSQAQWNSLGTAGQWHQLGDGFHIGPDDPRYAGIASQLHMTNGRDILFGSGNAPLNAQRVNGRTSFVDPNNVLQGDGAWATAHDNLTPQAEFSGGGLSDKGWAIAAASLLAGGALAGGALGGAAGAGAEGAGLAGDESAGLAMGGAGESGGAAAAGAAGDESAGLSMANPFSGGSTGLLGGAPVTDLSVPANGGVGVTDLSVPAQSQGLLGQAGQWAMNNPLRALGVAQTAYGLLGGHGSTSGASSGSNGSSGSKGGNGSSANFTVPKQQFYVNPYIAAQIKRGYGQ